MKETTPASCAPGVSSVGIMREVIASISLASSALKNPNLGGAADLAAWCACAAAASNAGQCAEAQAAESPVTPRDRKRRRLSDSFISGVLRITFQTVSRAGHSVKRFESNSPAKLTASRFRLGVPGP